jgi:hypothetical protein
VTLSHIKIGGGEAAKRRVTPPVGAFVAAAPGTPTFVVAASDALTSSINRSDYQCDGTADESEINSAIAALPSVGGRIVLTEGTFNISTTISLPGSTSIRFTGMEGTVLSFAADQHIIGGLNAHHTMFEGIKFTRPSGAGKPFIRGGGTSPGGRGYWVIDNCWFHNIEANYVLGIKGISNYASWIVTNNLFTSIVLNKGGINLDVSAVLIGDEGGSRDGYGIFANNHLSGVSKVGFAGNAHYIIHAQTNSAYIATGNYLENISGLSGYWSGNVHASHNMIEKVGTPGDHSGVSAAGIDSTAIHDNVASEISVIAEKTDLSSLDLMVMEDTDASNAKKRASVRNLRRLGTGTELTILGGAVTATSGYHVVDTEADATTDDLDTIGGGSAGELLVIQPASNARDIVVKDIIGNLRLATSDFTLNHSEDTLTLIHDGTVWCEVSRSSNSELLDLSASLSAVATHSFGSNQLHRPAGTVSGVADNSASLSVA